MARWHKTSAAMIALVVPILFASTVLASPAAPPPARSTTVALLSNRNLFSTLYHFSPAEKIVTWTQNVPSKVVSHGVRRTMIVTAYTRHDQTMNGRGITASGVPVQEGVTIAAPLDVPFGSKIYIPALNHIYTVTDRGGAIHGDRLDLFMESRDRAMEFGRKRLEVVISLP